MEQTRQNILHLALRLPDGDRAALAASLINSFDTETDSDVEIQWDAEIKRRVEETDNGTVALVPLSVVRQKIDRIRNDST